MSDFSEGNEVKRLGQGKKIVFALIPLLIFLLVTELVCRWIVFNQLSPYHTDFGVQANLRVEEYPLTIWGNRRFYLNPGLGFQYNEYGMRAMPGDVYMPVKGDNDFWVFLFGGSAIAGGGSNINGGFIKITGAEESSFSEGIDGFLQAELQASMPDKNVKVFNAAVFVQSVVQSRLNYERVRHLNPDWVISMDGYNDFLPSKVPIIDQYVSMWRRHPVNLSPYRQIRWLTEKSAALFLLAEYIYYRTDLIRPAVGTGPDPQQVQYWLLQSGQVASRSSDISPDIVTSADKFFSNVLLFNSILEFYGQKHLLLIQPALILRDNSRMPDVERAAFNLLINPSKGFEVNNAFMEYLYGNIPESIVNSDAISPMPAVHDWEGWVFLDYCHFSVAANQRIADGIAKFILSDGKIKPFL